MDITDVYAFHPPGLVGGAQDVRKLVLALNVNALSLPEETPTFSDEAEYVLFVDTDGDAEEDIEIGFEFEKPEDGVQKFEFEMEGDDFELEGEGTTGDLALEFLGGDVKVFAGLRDDPFFFDLGVLLGTSSGGTDTFAGKNVSSIVLEVPTRALLGEDDDDDDGDGHGPNTIGAWGAIEGTGQIDRMGIPTVNTVLIPTARKNFFNGSEPEDDVENFTADIVGTLTTPVVDGGFGRSAGDAAFIAGVLLPDILPLSDALLPTEFTFFNGGPVVLNGRNLEDDVIDSALRLVSGSNAATDGVPANDVPFPGAFPYLAPPH